MFKIAVQSFGSDVQSAACNPSCVQKIHERVVEQCHLRSSCMRAHIHGKSGVYLKDTGCK